MKILIDGDSCNTIDKIINKAKSNNTETHIYVDTKHLIDNSYASVHIVDNGPDAVDIAIANATDFGDIVYTNDGGLAMLVKAKNGKPYHFNGKPYRDSDMFHSLNNKCIRNKSFKKNKNKNVNSKHGHHKASPIYLKHCWN